MNRIKYASTWTFLSILRNIISIEKNSYKFRLHIPFFYSVSSFSKHWNGNETILNLQSDFVSSFLLGIRYKINQQRAISLVNGND